ncbi:hypothetical protein ACFQV2_16100 [Actinokineospora soli]|uniref:Uncharacterized protein n=1 Tax=Actinokineospora soli TaxID=1048753 RepID=A0ABW2TPU1_9PSEU
MYGQQPGYDPNQQQYGGAYQQPYGYGGGEPPKNNTGKIVAIVAIAVLVLAGAGVGVYFLTKDGGGTAGGTSTTQQAPKTTTESSEETTTEETTSEETTTTEESTSNGGGESDVASAAEKYVAAVNDQDESAAKALSCSGSDPGLMYTSVVPGNGEVEIVGQPDVYGTNASVDTKVTIPGSGVDPIDFPILFEEKSGKWCVSM